MAFRHLSDNRLAAVRDSIKDRGLNTPDDIGALTAGISPLFIGSIAAPANPNARLLQLTERMNSTPRLVSGEVPLVKFLGNAVELAGGTDEELVFRKALEEIEPDGMPETDAPVDVHAPPRRPDGALEVRIGEDDTLGVDFLLRGAVAARSVAKLCVHRHFGGSASFLSGDAPDWGLGTGWLIGPDLLITNYHVVVARDREEGAASDSDFKLQALATEAEFDYHGATGTTETVGVKGLEAMDRDLDYAVLRLGEGKAQRTPLRLRVNPLLRAEDEPLRQRVNVLQHPNGAPMRLGFRNNFVVTGSPERLSYLTDTAGGSSGSPLCDDVWSVAGLHRGWTALTTPVNVWGKLIRQENYGTPIARIRDHLGRHYSAVDDEVRAAQAVLS